MKPAESPKRIDSADLTAILAESSESDEAEIEQQAEEFFLEDPEDADWEYIEE